MKEELISIIVPVYKVEKYIHECIDSILSQTYKNIELLLIDDGSPDNCPRICDNYALKDKRIKVYHKKNGGLSDARNFGIDNSTGKYLMFIDSDDYIEKDMVELLYKNLKLNNADISICDCTFIYKDKKIKNDKRTDFLVMNREQALSELNKQNGFGFAAWNKLYKKEIFKKIRFPIGKINEDWYIMYKIFSQVKKAVYQPDSKYNYRQRKSSISKNTLINYNPILASSRCRRFIINKYPISSNEAYGNEIIADISVYNKLMLIKKCKIKKDYIRKNIKRNIYRMNSLNNYFKISKILQIYMILYIPIMYKLIYIIKEKKKSNFFD